MIIAQIENYNFEGYRQAEVVFRGLSTDPELFGNFASKTSPLDRRMLSHQGRFELPLDYFSIANTTKMQSQLNIDSDIEGSLNRSSADLDVSMLRRSLDQRARAFWQKDYYKNYNHFFNGFSVNVQLGYMSNRVKSDSTGVTQLHYSRNSPGVIAIVGWRFGWGRLENISNAWHSYRILNRLHFIERLDHVPSIDEINAFGQYLGEIKSYRLFDARLRNIAILQYVDGYLRDEFGLKANDIKYYTELNDMYRFGINAYRQMGSKLSISPQLRGNIRYSYFRDRENDQTANSTFLSYGPQLQVRYFKGMPYHRDFQLNVVLSLTGALNLIENRNESARWSTEEWFTSKDIRSELELFLGYYPTTRTSYVVRTMIGVEDSEVDSDGPFLPWNYKAQVDWTCAFGFTYFISPFTTMNTGIRILYMNGGSKVPNYLVSVGRGNETDKTWTPSVRLRLNHIFY